MLANIKGLKSNDSEEYEIPTVFFLQVEICLIKLCKNKVP